VIFPGVGEASSAMAYLRERRLDDVIRSLTQPVLGICLGLQLLCDWSEENDTECLGIFPHRVLKFGSTSSETRSQASSDAGSDTGSNASPGPAPRLKVPQIGWNTVEYGSVDAGADTGSGRSLFQGIPQQAHFYFVHSFYAEPGRDTCAVTDYGCRFSSSLARDNFYAVQFHPEKSAEHGARLLENFLMT